ncbi:MAG: DUF1289 domain-containing protein [Wenzhouxiangella sp.]
MAEAASPLPQIESPCIGTCTLGPDRLCIGCFRTGSEIAGWLGFSVAERRKIMKELPERAQSLFADD